MEILQKFVTIFLIRNIWHFLQIWPLHEAKNACNLHTMHCNVSKLIILVGFVQKLRCRANYRRIEILDHPCSQCGIKNYSNLARNFWTKNLLIAMMAFIFRILVLFGFRQDLLIIIISAVPASVILTFFHCNFHVKRLSEMIIIGAALIYCENNQLSVGLPLISFFLCFFVFGRKSIIKEES